MNNISNQTRHDAAVELSNSNLTQIENACAAVFLIGGSGVSIGIVDSNGASLGTTRSTPWHEFGLSAENTLSNQEKLNRLFDTLFTQTKTLLEESSVKNINILGLSFAGPMVKVGDDYKVHGPNMGLEFTQPIRECLHSYAQQHGFNNIPLKHIHALNDGTAGALGEIYSDISLTPKKQDLIYLILGTGIGGARIVNNAVDATFTEAGHTLIRGPSGAYTYYSMEDLALNGLFQDGRFITPDDGRTFLEHRLGGPWVAIRFAKHLLQRAPQTFAILHEVELPHNCPSITPEALIKIANLNEDSIATWNMCVDKNVERALNMILRSYAQSESASDNDSLSKLSREFELEMYNELGSALKTLKEQFPDAHITLGSSLAEIRRNDLQFIEAISDATKFSATVSSITSGTVREAAAFTQVLKDFLLAEQSA